MNRRHKPARNQRRQPKEEKKRRARRAAPAGHGPQTISPAPVVPLLRLVRDHPNASALQPVVARQLLALQATHGNQFVERLVKAAAEANGPEVPEALALAQGVDGGDPSAAVHRKNDKKSRKGVPKEKWSRKPKPKPASEEKVPYRRSLKGLKPVTLFREYAAGKLQGNDARNVIRAKMDNAGTETLLTYERIIRSLSGPGVKWLKNAVGYRIRSRAPSDDFAALRRLRWRLLLRLYAAGWVSGDTAKRVIRMKLDGSAWAELQSDSRFVESLSGRGATWLRQAVEHRLGERRRGERPAGALHRPVELPFTQSEPGPIESLPEPEAPMSGPVEAGGTTSYEQSEVVEGYEAWGVVGFDWVLAGNEMVVTVPFRFTGAPPRTSTWFSQIRSRWNQFTAVNTATHQRVLITFQPQESGRGHEVTVHSGGGRSSQNDWYLDDMGDGTAPHEFGHMIGLNDEYSVTEEHYVGLTGSAVPAVEASPWLSGASPAEVARELHAELSSQAPGPGGRVHGVIFRHGFGQGEEFARAVARAYRREYREDVVARIAALQVSDDFDEVERNQAVEVFTYSSSSLMGTMDEPGDIPSGLDHDHGAQPRHVRAFVQLIQSVRGGRWVPTPR
jgi:hypothetical protein